MTKPANRTPAKREKRAASVATIVDTGNRAAVAEDYAAHIEGWDALPRQQQDAIIALTEAYRAKPKPLEVSLSRNEAGRYSTAVADGDSPTYHVLKLAETFGSASLPFSSDRLGDLINHFHANANRGASQSDINAALAFINGAKPQNEVEATLAVQMVATHDAAMRALAMIGKSEWVPQTQLFGNLAIKLLRTFTMQAEALAKLQRGGEQVVRHVHVDNRGGQAVIAESIQTGGRNAKPDEQPHATAALGF